MDYFSWGCCPLCSDCQTYYESICSCDIRAKDHVQVIGRSGTVDTSIAAVDSANASLHLNLGLNDADIKNISKIIPALDTLLPMTRSFEGNVDFVLNGTSKLNSQMGIELSSLRAIGRVKGENLVIMDSETFSQISKTLMLKNKERNVVDSASFEMLIANNTMEILPSMVSIDRYQVAIGCTHKIDMTYAYHVSVLKSLMPFKAGIELLGD